MSVVGHPAPVTVSITRHVDPEHHDEMLAWLRAGTQLSERFEGFLGSGWVRPSADSTLWHMLYRFDSPGSLARWNESPQRAWWLNSATGFVQTQHEEQRTGIEGWFDEPAEIDAADLRSTPSPPPRWKQMVSIFLVFFPLSLVLNWLGREYAADWLLPVRVLVTVLIMTPLMTYVFLPFVTRLLAPWLHATLKDRAGA